MSEIQRLRSPACARGAGNVLSAGLGEGVWWRARTVPVVREGDLLRGVAPGWVM